MPILRALTFLALLALTPASSAAVPHTRAETAARQGVQAEDLMEVRRIRSVALAPDASFVVFSVQSPHGDLLGGDPSKTGYDTHLYYLDLADPDARPRALTTGPRSDSDPRISPDGRTLAFVRRGAERSAGPDGARAQVWLLPLDGPGEARQLTELPHGASGPRWRPDGEALVVGSSLPFSEIPGTPDWPMERPAREWPSPDGEDEADGEDADAPPPHPDGGREELREWLESNEDDAGPAVLHRLDFQGERGLSGEMRFRHLFLVPLADDAEPVQLTEGFHSFGDPAWFADGRRLVCAGPPAEAEHPDRVRRRALHLLRVDGRELRPLLDSSQYTVGSPRLSADGETLYFTAQARDEPTFRQRHLGRLRADGSGVTRIDTGWDGHVQGLRVEGERSLLFQSGREGTVRLVRRDLEDGGFAEVGGLPGSVEAFDTAAGTAVAAVSSAADPSALWIVPREGAPRELWSPHTDLLASRAVSMPVERWLTREDGTRVQYWVLPPVTDASLDDGARHPVVLSMHGGPHVMWGPGTYSMWHEHQLLCARGYGVVYANPRGSNGYGYAFQKGNYRDWGVGPSGDVLAALDAALEEFAWMDRDQLFLTGGSYAGYLTAWIVTHTDRFQAAVAQRGVYDLKTFFGEGNAYSLVKYAFGGWPWEPEVGALLEAQSPFHYVQRIVTPLMILHGSRDLRTGVSQSEMMYRALKVLERPVEYVRYREGDHDLSRTGSPRMRVDRLSRILEFFDRYRASKP